MTTALITATADGYFIVHFRAHDSVAFSRAIARLKACVPSRYRRYDGYTKRWRVQLAGLPGLCAWGEYVRTTLRGEVRFVSEDGETQQEALQDRPPEQLREDFIAHQARRMQQRQRK
jgi:hypothetical protein